MNSVFKKAEEEIRINSDNRKSVFAKVEELINGERAQTYGNAVESFQQIADFWTVYCKRMFGSDIFFSKQDVANMMILMKISRVQNNGHHDSYVDIIGYAGLAVEKL